MRSRFLRSIGFTAKFFSCANKIPLECQLSTIKRGMRNFSLEYTAAVNKPNITIKRSNVSRLDLPHKRTSEWHVKVCWIIDCVSLMPSRLRLLRSDSEPNSFATVQRSKHAVSRKWIPIPKIFQPKVSATTRGTAFPAIYVDLECSQTVS